MILHLPTSFPFFGSISELHNFSALFFELRRSALPWPLRIHILLVLLGLGTISPGHLKNCLFKLANTHPSRALSSPSKFHLWSGFAYELVNSCLSSSCPGRTTWRCRPCAPWKLAPSQQGSEIPKRFRTRLAQHYWIN